MLTPLRPHLQTDVNLKKDQDQAAKRREYMRQYQRERRAAARKAALTGSQGGQQNLKGSRSVTRRRTTSVLSVPDADELTALDEVHRLGYSAGASAIAKAAAAIESCNPDGLNVSDLKRLVEVGVRLLEVCSPALSEEVSEEESLIFTDEMLGDDDAIDAVESILTISAKQSQQIEAAGSADIAEGCGSGEELPGGLREGGQ